MSEACASFHLTISTKETEVVRQPAPGNPYSEPNITVNRQKLQVVDKFTYLGSTLSRAVHIYDEVTAKTVKASVAFGKLRTNVLSHLNNKCLTAKLLKHGYRYHKLRKAFSKFYRRHYDFSWLGPELLSVAWSTGAQLIIFFCFSVVLFDRPGISIRHAAHCVGHY